MMSGKKRTFFVFDYAMNSQVLTGDIDRTLEYIKTYLLEMEDGTEHIFEVERRDMTEAEIEALPVV